MAELKAENERVAEKTRRQIETKLEEAADDFIAKIERLEKCESKLRGISTQVIDNFITTLARLNCWEANPKEGPSNSHPRLTLSEDNKARSLSSPVTTQLYQRPDTAEIPRRKLEPPDEKQNRLQN